MILTRLDVLKYTKVMVVLTSFCGTVCTSLLSVASSTALVQTSQKRPQIPALFDSWSGSTPPLFPGASPAPPVFSSELSRLSSRLKHRCR